MAVNRGPILKFFWWYHKLLLRLTGGRAFNRIGKLNVLLLRTVGRKSANRAWQRLATCRTNRGLSWSLLTPEGISSQPGG
jgi:hypothetical protein